MLRAFWGLGLVLTSCGHVVPAEVVQNTSFQALDTNHDGKLTVEESQLSAIAFLTRDANGDGMLDPLEWLGQPDPTLPARQAEQQEDQKQTVMDPHHTGPVY